MKRILSFVLAFILAFSFVEILNVNAVSSNISISCFDDYRVVGSSLTATASRNLPSVATHRPN